MDSLQNAPALQPRESFLTKREVKNLNAGIQELDLKGAVYDWAFLPNELIHAGLANFAVAVRRGVNSVILAGRGAVQRDFEPNRLAVLRRSQNQIQVAAWNRNTTLPGTSLQHRCFRADVPRSDESPLVQRRRRRRAIGPLRVSRHFFRRSEMLGLPVADVRFRRLLIVARRGLDSGARPVTVLRRSRPRHFLSAVSG